MHKNNRVTCHKKAKYIYMAYMRPYMRIFDKFMSLFANFAICWCRYPEAGIPTLTAARQDLCSYP